MVSRTDSQHSRVKLQPGLAAASFPINPSSILQVYLACIHILLATCPLLLTEHYYLSIPLTTAALIKGLYSVKRERRVMPGAVNQLSHRDGTLYVRIGDDEQAVTIKMATVWPKLIVLQLVAEYAGVSKAGVTKSWLTRPWQQNLCLTLFPDSMPPNDFRRLRVLLRQCLV